MCTQEPPSATNLNLITTRGSRKRPAGKKGAVLKNRRRLKLRLWYEKKARLEVEAEEAKVRFGTDRVVYLDGEWFPKDSFKCEEDERIFQLARRYAKGLKFPPSLMYEEPITASNVSDQQQEQTKEKA